MICKLFNGVLTLRGLTKFRPPKSPTQNSLLSAMASTTTPRSGTFGSNSTTTPQPSDPPSPLNPLTAPHPTRWQQKGLGPTFNPPCPPVGAL